MTAEQAFLTRDGWKPLCALCPSDAVAVVAEYPQVFGRGSSDAAMVKVLAYLTAGGTLSDGALNVVAPPGFYAEIEGVVRNRRGMGYGAAIVRVLPRPALPPRQASVDVSQATGKIDWRVSLGSLSLGFS